VSRLPRSSALVSCRAHVKSLVPAYSLRPETSFGAPEDPLDASTFRSALTAEDMAAQICSAHAALSGMAAFQAQRQYIALCKVNRL
jgi:hypothetical protein